MVIDNPSVGWTFIDSNGTINPITPDAFGYPEVTTSVGSACAQSGGNQRVHPLFGGGSDYCKKFQKPNACNEMYETFPDPASRTEEWNSCCTININELEKELLEIDEDIDKLTEKKKKLSTALVIL